MVLFVVKSLPSDGSRLSTTVSAAPSSLSLPSSTFLKTEPLVGSVDSAPQTTSLSNTFVAKQESQIQRDANDGKRKYSAISPEENQPPDALSSRLTVAYPQAKRASTYEAEGLCLFRDGLFVPVNCMHFCTFSVSRNLISFQLI